MTAASVRRWVRSHERLRRLAGRVVAAAERLRTGRMSVRERWSRAIPYESSFWEDWLETHAFGDEEQYRARLDPEAPVTDGPLVRCLDAIPDAEIRVLDVGAGPLTTVGKTFRGRRLSVTAVDPLAADYDRLLERAGVVPPVRTVEAHGERLLERFEPGSFDVAFAANALDHCYDPALVVRNMLEVVEPGRFVVLLHHRNEAEAKGYLGLHQWNFDVQDGRFVIWNRDSRVDVTQELAGRADVAAELDGDDVVVRITRSGTP
ncbi:MAG TPA: class I SAM-dependent methyltransferase [Gaiellaceae bacterium]|nr:class I SAM-dependent methyltransferase [Gaiellaceae bacterium]